MNPPLTQSATAYREALSEIDNLLQGRTFDVAPREQIDTTAKEVFELVSYSRDVPRSLVLAAQMFFKEAASNTKHSRSFSLVAREVYFQLSDLDKEVAYDFKYELENLAVAEFTHFWKSATDCSIHTGLHRNEPSLRAARGYLETYNHVKDLSIVLSDYYAMGFVSPRAFEKVVEVIAERFDQRDYLIYLIIMLSRANSHRGKSLSYSWYLDLLWQIRTRCIHFFDDREPKEEESCLTRLVRGLINDLTERGGSSMYCKIPVSYYEIEGCDTKMMVIEGRDEIEELYYLDSRSAPLNDPDSDCAGSPPPAIAPVDFTQRPEEGESALYNSPEEAEFEVEDEDEGKDTSGSCPTRPRRRTRKLGTVKRLSPLAPSLASSVSEGASRHFSSIAHLPQLSKSVGPNVDLRQNACPGRPKSTGLATTENPKVESRIAPTPVAPRGNPLKASVSSTNSFSRSHARARREADQSKSSASKPAKSQGPHAELQLSDLMTTSELKRTI